MPRLESISISSDAPVVPISTAKAIPIFIPETATEKSGYMKVKLTYLTDEPRHIQSLMLRDLYGTRAPYLESAYVLLPQERCFDLLEVYVSAFHEMIKSKIVPISSRLQDFEIMGEDTQTQAYVFNFN